MLEFWEGHHQKELWAKEGLVGHSAGRVLLSVPSEGDFDLVGLFSPILDGAVRHPIRIERGPLVVPPKLG